MPEALPIIGDPWFYAIAVPMVLLTGVSKSGFASGFGSLAVPLMALSIPVPQAAAIMLPLLLVMDATGLQQLWRNRDRGLVRLLVPWGLGGTAVGTVVFGWLPASLVSGVVGAVTLLFLAQRLAFPARPDAPEVPRWVGRLCALLSGFTSFIAHAGGPPLNAYLLPLKRAPLLTAGTMSVFFAAINLSKCVPYAWLGLIDLRNMLTAAMLMPLAPLGVWFGVRMAHRVSPVWFYRIGYGGMFVSGVKLLWDGLYHHA